MSEPSQESRDQDLFRKLSKTPSNSRSAGASSRDFDSALAELTDSRRVADADGCRVEWAELTVRLGDMYLKRRLGEKAENLKSAVECFQDALAVYERQSFPREWTLCNRKLGRTYLELSDGHSRVLKDLSRVRYEMALAMITKDQSPELWHVLHLELAILFRKCSQSPEDEDARLSDEHHEIAFELNREQWPETYDLMRTSYDLHLRFFDLQSELRAVVEGTPPLSFPAETGPPGT
jgi:hypothetical protein